MERQCYVARSTGHIQHGGGMSFRYCLNQALSPKDIQPKAENAVVAVVRRCEVGEKSLNPFSVIGGVQLAVDFAGALGEVVVKVRFSLSAPTLTRSPALIFPRMTSSAIGSSRYLSIARRSGRAP